MISLFFFLINFAVGGVTAIFWGNAPIRVTQGYLVIISVIISYLLSFFPEWTSWTLMVGLSFYDMFAVLTPYGPLKCLVEMAMEKGDPIPGLIYEAKLVHDDDDAAVPVPVHTAQGGRPPNPPAAEPKGSTYHDRHYSHTYLENLSSFLLTSPHLKMDFLQWIICNTLPRR